MSKINWEAEYKSLQPVVQELTLQIEGGKDKLKDLQAKLRAVVRDNITTRDVRTKIFGLKDHPKDPPSWTVDVKPGHVTPAVPMTIWSDWHWGEVVDPTEVNGVNEYNPDIAQRRVKHLVSQIIHLCRDQAHHYDIPGIVVCLGGDMVSGDIHEELLMTNAMPTMPVVIDMANVLIWAITKLADEFGFVFLPCVTGNHGRDRKKPMYKQRVHTNYDWLLYTILERHFKDDKRVRFMISEGFDCFFRVHDHKYCLTHGDNLGVKGGDGIIGAIGPIMRGNIKVRHALRQIGRDFDTLLMGHWHQYINLIKLIVNGSLKGHDEYAQGLRFGLEPPAQAFWFNHPKHGIGWTMQMFAEPEGPAALKTRLELEDVGPVGAEGSVFSAPVYDMKGPNA